MVDVAFCPGLWRGLLLVTGDRSPSSLERLFRCGGSASLIVLREALEVLRGGVRVGWLIYWEGKGGRRTFRRKKGFCRKRMQLSHAGYGIVVHSLPS